MRFTALIREVRTRDIRVVFSADSKGQAKRLATNIAGSDRYKQGIVASEQIEVSPLLNSIEQITHESNLRIQKEMRK